MPKAVGVEVIVGDGRNYLLLSDKTYDVITIDPPLPPWGAGTVNLYTTEFYELCRKRLKPGGIVCQWLPTTFASLSEEQYKMLLATFVDAFPHTSVWNSPNEGGTYLIATSTTLSIDANSFCAYFDSQTVSEDLSRYSNMTIKGQDVLSLHTFAVYQSTVRAVVYEDIPTRRGHDLGVPS